MRKTKILYISYDSALEPIPQSQVIPYLKGLSEEGYVFHWLSYEKASSLVSKAMRDELKQELIKHNIFWHSLPYYKRPYFVAKIFNILCGLIVSSFLVLKYDISIIHCRSEVASVIGMAAKAFFRKKIIYDRRGFMAEDYVEGGMWKGRDSLLYKLLIYIDIKLLSHSDKIVILTHKMKDWLTIHRPMTEDKISVIPSCVDLSRFNFSNNGTIKAELGFEKKFMFVYTGSLGTWYLLSDMIDFFIIAKKYIPNAHFLILTMNEEIAENIIKAKKVKISNFTIKHVPFKDVPKFLQCSEAAVCFIKPVLSKFASSPTKLAEFLASGIPVIMNSGIGDSDEILERERAGVIVKDFNNDDYRKSVNDLLLLINEKEVLKKRCTETANKYFSLDDGIAKYSKIYKDLLWKG